MIKNVPLAVHAADRAVIVSAREVNPVVDDGTAVGEWTRRGIGSRVVKAASALGRVYKIVRPVYLARGARLEEAVRLRSRDYVQLVAPGDGFVHVVLQLAHVASLIAAVDVHPAVVVDQHAGVDESAVVVVVRNIVLIPGQQPERTLRAVGDCNTALCIHDVRV